jgi:class 3 adenylate cyclase
MTSSDTNRQRLAAILAADAAGYSRLMSIDEAGTLAALEVARTIFRTYIESCQGRVIDMAGDSVLAVFETASGAVRAALSVQERLDALAVSVPADRRLRFRIGVHLGDVTEKTDGSVYGGGVNIAARLEGLSLPGGITISDAVYGSVRHRVAANFEDLGERQVKNIAEPVRAFRVVAKADGDDASTLSRWSLPAAAHWLARRWQSLALVVSMLVLAGVVVVYVVPGLGGRGPVGGVRPRAAAASEPRPQLVWMEAVRQASGAARIAAASAEVPLPAHPTWEYVGSVDGDTIWVAWATFSASGDVRRVWAILDLKVAVRPDGNRTGDPRGGVRSALQLIEFDCKGQRERTLQQTWFAGPLASEGVVAGGKGNPDWWEHWAPGTIDDLLLQAVCQHWLPR